MGIYSFEKRFVPKILSGEKQHTIRGERRNADKPGKILHLYSGLRTKKTKLIMRVLCVKVERIEIDIAEEENNVAIDGVALSRTELEALAKRDGFDSFFDMMDFWEGRLPFAGHNIHWRFDSRDEAERKWKETQGNPARARRKRDRKS